MKYEELNNKLRRKADSLYTDRIGDDCFCDAISVALEFRNRLYWAFDYVDYKFFITSIFSLTLTMQVIQAK